MRRTLFETEHEDFRATVGSFLDREMVPQQAKWSAQGHIDRSCFESAGRLGLLGVAAPEELGGGGVDDFRYNVVLNEEIHARGLNGPGLGFTLHNDIVLPYLLKFADTEQQRRWLPAMCDGTAIGAVAMTEPGAGSDLAAIGTEARREGDHYVVNGSKTFISNGINADVVVTAVKTDPTQRHRGMSLLVLERGMAGFERGRRLEKVGLHAQDTAELSFVDVIAPVANRLGEEGEGFTLLAECLVQERLSIAVTAIAAARAALEGTVAYVRDRELFGRTLAEFQNARFVLADIATEVEIGQVYVDRAVSEHMAGELTPSSAAKAKWWTTELQKSVVDKCVQLHGGYGYMLETPIGRAYQDARITTIYGGATEVMKEIIARSLLPGSTVPRVHSKQGR
ncbi:acyl-CoA dehydrogenase family protein [Gordonia sp. NPDC058843]|uniref:acyl-CoA dehydrogenase family protein n=1 Tax=Gordonia sp. NPDC058843 TaxID=3346648 RepID=UPI00368596B9